MISYNLETLALLSSRTQLRISLANYIEDPNIEAQDKMNMILDDAKNSIERLIQLSVSDLNGTVIASTARSNIGVNVSHFSFFEESKISPLLNNFFLDKDNNLNLYLSTPLFLDNILIGVMIGISTADNIVLVVQENIGLGETGELILANKTSNGNSLVLVPLRFNSSAALAMVIPREDTSNPINMATSGIEGVYEDIIDYRGEEVLVVTKYISQTKWGLIVKIDKNEAFAAIKIQEQLIFATFLISFIILSISYYLINRFLMKPLEELTNLANELSLGNLERRVNITSIYEIEILANTLNSMAINLSQIKTELGESVDQLQISQNHLIRSQKMEAIGRLAGGVAHDFNNLLTVILGYTELLQSRIKDPDDFDNLVEISMASLKAKEITSQLLLFSKKSVVKEEIICANEVMDEILSLITRLMRENIQIEITHITNNLHVNIERTKFEQIIMNLALNSSQAMEDGGFITILLDKKMGLNINNESITGEFLEIKISDTGTGMSPQTIENIFDPFFTTKVEGTGLGLSVVYGIIQQSNGHIQVESELDAGTIISVYLPLCEFQIKSMELEKENSIHSSRKNITILVVEDEISIKQLIEQLLISHNYSPIISKDIFDAIDIAMSQTIDLLITDVIMPNMDGMELSVNLTEINPFMKTLFISGYAQTELTITKNIEFLQKPFELDKLMSKISKLFKL